MKSPNKTSSQVIFKVKPLTKKELCAVLGVSLKILNRWIAKIKNELGERRGYRFNVRQVNLLIEKYGALPHYFTNKKTVSLMT